MTACQSPHAQSNVMFDLLMSLHARGSRRLPDLVMGLVDMSKGRKKSGSGTLLCCGGHPHRPALSSACVRVLYCFGYSRRYLVCP